MDPETILHHEVFEPFLMKGLEDRDYPSLNLAGSVLPQNEPSFLVSILADDSAIELVQNAVQSTQTKKCKEERWQKAGACITKSMRLH